MCMFIDISLQSLDAGWLNQTVFISDCTYILVHVVLWLYLSTCNRLIVLWLYLSTCNRLIVLWFVEDRQKHRYLWCNLVCTLWYSFRITITQSQHLLKVPSCHMIPVYIIKCCYFRFWKSTCSCILGISGIFQCLLFACEP